MLAVDNESMHNIFLSKNVSHALKVKISYGLGFSHVDNLGKYLGVSLLHQRVKKDNLPVLSSTR